MSRKQEDLMREVMKQKEGEIVELRELYFSLLTKRIESEQQLIEGGKVKPFTPESASQKRGFEDSTVILKEERERVTKQSEEEENKKFNKLYELMENLGEIIDRIKEMKEGIKKKK